MKSDSENLQRLVTEMLCEGLAAVNPQMVSRDVSVGNDVVIGNVCLSETIWGDYVPQNLRQVVAVVYTLGRTFDEWVVSHDGCVSKQLVADGIGTAVMRLFYNQIMEQIRLRMSTEQLGNVSAVAYPGSLEWPIRAGQELLLHLVDGQSIGVEMNASGMLTPLKSCTMLVGIGTADRFHVVNDICSGCPKNENCDLKCGMIDEV